MAGYRNLAEHCAAPDRRNTRYRFDLERDLRWEDLDAGGALFGPRFLGALGLDAEAGAHPLFQWALALAVCEEFIALEDVIVRFAERERALLGPTRSMTLLVEEEEKHILLFRRWADHLRKQRPADCARFDHAFADSAQLVGQLDDRAGYPDDASYHYVFWLNTLVFEEYTIYLHECLRADDGIQPAWLAAHAAHRREEEQHLVTDAAHLEALDLDDETRDRWSKMYFVRLSRNAARFFGLEASLRFFAEADPDAALRLGAAPRFESTPLYRELLAGRAFRRTRKAAPYLARLGETERTSFGDKLRGLFSRKQPPELERFVLRKPPAGAVVESVPQPEPDGDHPLAVVRRVWATVFGLEPAQIGLDDSFTSIGGDSPRAVEIHGLLERHYGRTLDPRILLECRTVREFAAFLAHPPAPIPAAPVLRAATHEIAIIGAQGRFPGAHDLDELWDTLAHGRSAIGPVPPDRWDADAWYDPDPRAPGKAVCRVGGFLEDVRGFDPEAFGLDEAAAREMDPQQRLFLELSADLLDGTGAPERRVGVFAGAGYNAYALRFANEPTRIGRLSALGNLPNMVAARVSQVLGLTGPALTVNAACASSLVAIHLACRSLRAGECELAIAGGVELYLTPTPFLMFSQAGVISPSGRCRPFSRHADGFVPGEGAGAVLLKPLDRALADGDEILGVVKGSAMNNDGGGLSGLAPSPAGQLDVLRRAYADAGMSPAEVSYVEAHGTGTPVGDPVEVRALSLLVAERGAGGGRFIGSLKGNLGHLFNAAGVASVIKVLLAMRHGTLPPTVGCEEPDPRIDFPSSGFSPVQRLEPWRRTDGAPRRAGVSAFGVGGTNCHVVVEEPPGETRPAPAARELELLCLSAPSDADLARVAAAHGAWLAAHGDADLPSFASALNARADRFPVRRALICGSVADARAQLATVRKGVHAAGRPRLCFLLPGPGSQYPGMGRHLYDREPVFRAALAECSSRLADARALERPLEAYLYDEPQLSAPRMDRIEVTQPLVFSFGYALARWLESVGVRPNALIGHSAGEVLAACLAGALSLDDALALVTARGQAMAVSAEGKMAAVFADEPQVRALLGPELSIAALNEPGQVVLSGAAEPMDRALAALARDGVTTRELRISCAAHSPLMEPIKPRFAEALAQVDLQAPSLPIYSAVTARRVGTLDEAYWLEHLSAPVDFRGAVWAAAADGYDTFVELGGGGSLSHCVTQLVPEARVAPLLRRSVPGWEPTLAALGSLHEAGVGISFDPGRPRAPLPPYPYRKREMWIEDDGPAPTGGLDLSTDPSLLDHRVHDRAIAPAALLIDHTLQAVREKDPAAGGLADLVIGRPLPGDRGRRARIRLSGERVLLESWNGTRWEAHLSGRVLPGLSPPAPLDPQAIASRVGAPVAADELYRHLEASGLTYGPTMRSVESLACGDGEVLAQLVAPEGSRPGPLPAAIVDGAMQAIAGLTLGRGGNDPATFLGFGVGEVRTFAPLEAPCLAHITLRSPLDEKSESFRVDVTLADPAGHVRARFLDVALKRFRDPARPRSYAVRWQPAALPATHGPTRSSVLLFGPKSPLQAALKRKLEDGGVPVRETEEAPDPRRQPIEAVIAVEPALEPLFGLVQALGPAPDALDLFVISRDPALAGLLRAAGEEHPGWRCRAVELGGEPQSADRLATRLVAEWRAAPERVLVAYEGAERRAPVLEPLDGGGEQALRDRGVYLITGGLGGIGLELARLFARRAHARLLLTGRRAEADRQTLAELERLGGEALYVRADVTDAAQMKAAVDAAVARWGAVHAVVHAAGILDDQLIDARTPERRRAVLAPKIDGTRVLLDACSGQPLDFVVLCSSLASLFGGAGQADYAAANAHLDGLARHAPAGARIVSIDWGPWRDVGMVAAPEYQRRFQAAGLQALAPAAAARALLGALASGERQVAITGVDPAREVELRARFNRIGPLEPAAPDELPAGERPPVRDFLRRELSARLRRELDPRASFVELGVDSLLAVEMVRKLERRYARKLHPTLLFELKTIDEVAAYVESSNEGAAPAPAPIAAPVGPSHEAWLAGDLPLTFARAADDPVADDQIEIEVRAAGVNFIDLLAARGMHPILGARRFVPGHEVAGVITRVGAAVRDRAVGERVMAVVKQGGYARRVVTPAISSVPLPEKTSFEEGAALVISGLTAISCLEHHARLQPGERVLIQAAAGATGLACVQLALHAGAEIFGTASAPEKLMHLAHLGVQHPIDYQRRAFDEVVRELTGGEGVDVIVDSLSGDAITRGLALLRPGGRFLEIGAAGVVDVPPVDPRRLFLANQSFVACNVGLLDRTPALLEAHLHRLRALAAEGVLKPTIGARIPFAAAPDAHDLIRQRKNIGKVVLVL